MEKEELTNLIMEFVEDKFPNLIEGEKDKNFFRNGDTYYYILSNGEVNKDFWTDHQIDKGRLSFGNVFKTQEEAEFEAEKRKVLHELSELACPFSYESNNWCFYLNSEGEIDYYAGDDNQYLYGDYYFDSREEAVRAVEKIGKDRIRKCLLVKEY